MLLKCCTKYCILATEYMTLHIKTHIDYKYMDREKYAMPTLVKRKEEDFPSSSMVKNLLGNAGDTGSIPGWGRFHMQLSPCPTTTEPSL